MTRARAHLEDIMADGPVNNDTHTSGPKNRFRALLAAGTAVVAMAVSGCANLSVATPGGTTVNTGPGGVSGSTTVGGGRVGGSVNTSTGQVCPSIQLPVIGWVSGCTNPGAVGGGGQQAPEKPPAGGKRPGL
jgi:hypothetical protein